MSAQFGKGMQPLRSDWEIRAGFEYQKVVFEASTVLFEASIEFFEVRSIRSIRPKWTHYDQPPHIIVIRSCQMLIMRDFQRDGWRKTGTVFTVQATEGIALPPNVWVLNILIFLIYRLLRRFTPHVFHAVIPCAISLYNLRFWISIHFCYWHSNFEASKLCKLTFEAS